MLRSLLSGVSFRMRWGGRTIAGGGASMNCEAGDPSVGAIITSFTWCSFAIEVSGASTPLLNSRGVSERETSAGRRLLGRVRRDGRHGDRAELESDFSGVESRPSLLPVGGSEPCALPSRWCCRPKPRVRFAYALVQRRRIRVSISLALH